ncbi:MAG: LptF/LptG family permease [Ghiorsea sp.]|nr:LptF/LptG family permease [Ghiorsea sp.]
MFSTLNLYILRLWAMPFVVIFILINAIFLIRKVSIWLPILVEHEAPIALTVSLFLSMVPMDLVMTIPIAFFFALIKLILDLQSNSELDVMYAGGRSILNIVSPVFWMGVLLTLVMFVLTLELVPTGKVVSHNIAARLNALNAAPSFEPRHFIDDIDDMVFYFDGKNPDGSYANFMLTDSRSKTGEVVTYFSEKAVLSRIDAGLVVSLFSGTQLIGERDTLRSVKFSNYDIVVPLAESKRYFELGVNKPPAYMDAVSLFHTLSLDTVTPAHRANWHFRLVLALSVLVLFCYAVSISLRAKRSKQGAVFLFASLVMWAINQAEMIVFRKTELGILPWWSLWLVLGLFSVIGLWLLYMVQQRGVIYLRRRKRV